MTEHNIIKERLEDKLIKDALDRIQNAMSDMFFDEFERRKNYLSVSHWGIFES